MPPPPLQKVINGAFLLPLPTASKVIAMVAMWWVLEFSKVINNSSWSCCRIGKNEIPIPVNHCLQTPHHDFQAPHAENWWARKTSFSEASHTTGNKRRRVDDGPKCLVNLWNQAFQRWRAQEDFFSWNLFYTGKTIIAQPFAVSRTRFIALASTSKGALKSNSWLSNWLSSRILLAKVTLSRQAQQSLWHFRNH